MDFKFLLILSRKLSNEQHSPKLALNFNLSMFIFQRIPLKNRPLGYELIDLNMY